MMEAQALAGSSPKGEVTVADGRFQVVFRRSYRKPITKVWAALTIPERLADWFGAAQVDGRVGGSLRIAFPDGAVIAMAVTRFEPPHVLGLSWRLDGIDTSVLFELAPSDDGCTLTLTHGGLDASGSGSGVRAGWHAHLDGLSDSLDGRATPWSVTNQRVAALQVLYPSLRAG